MHYFLAFSIAVFATSYSPFLPPFITLWLLLLLTIGSIYWRYFLIASILLGLITGFYQGYSLVDQQLPPELAAIPITVIGTVSGLPMKDQRRQRFLLSVDAVVGQDLPSKEHLIGKTLQLSIYRHNNTSPLVIDIATGQQWRLTVKLRRPRGFVNPAGIDYQAYLLRRHIAATGYVVSANAHNAITQKLVGDNCAAVMVDCIRWHIKERLSSLAEGSKTVGVITALAVGDSQAIDNKQWEVFKNTGTVHLLAISGLHIGLAAVIGAFIGRSLMRLIGIFRPFSIGLRVLPAIFSIALSLIYSLLAGMSLPTQRALIMVLVYQCCVLLGYRVSAWLLLSIALSGVAIIDPLAVQNTGFWLSFLAVAVLLYGFLGYQPSIMPWLYRQSVQGVKAQWLLTLGLLLPSLFWLQGGSISAPLVNLFAIPWVSLLVVPLIFLLLALLCLQVLWATIFNGAILQGFLEWVFYVISLLVTYLMDGLRYTDQIVGEFWYPSVQQPTIIAILFGFVGITYILSPKGLPYRYCGLLLLLPVCLPSKSPAVLRATFLDVGQGTAVVIETKDHRLIYDTGRRFSGRFNAGEHIIAPYLRSIGGSTINKVIVSHADSDHAGGLSGLLNNVNIDGEILSGEPTSLSPTGDISAQQCYQGQQWQWDDVTFSVLWPSHSYLTRSRQEGSKSKGNNVSCVLLISYEGENILLTGDIEKEAEYGLLGIADLPENIDIMLVPHHGSKTSSSDS
ncbi:MAG: competence protein ComEC, partial [Candidatus Endobugula sp.]